MSKNAKSTYWQDYLSPRILLVDDDMSIRTTLSNILSQAGYIVDTAENGEEAILKSNSNFYHLALIDLRLPDMAGTKLLTLLRPTVPKMRKIIITGYPVLEHAVEAINRGVDGYMVKPLNMPQLLKTIRQALEKQSKDKELTEAQLVEYVNSRVKSTNILPQEEKAKEEKEETESCMRVRVGDCEFTWQILLYVFLSIGSNSVSFGGVAYGEEAEYIRNRLNMLAQEKAIPYEAVDRDGYESAGICSIEELKFEETPTYPVRIQFSAQLVHPFIRR